MPSRPVHNKRGQGVLRVDRSSSLKGPGDEFETLLEIDSDGVVRQASNYGTPVEAVLGDGRHWMPIQSATPTALQPGQFWIETIGSTEYFAFVDANGNPNYLAGGGGTPVGGWTKIGPIALTDGVPILCDLNITGDAFIWQVHFMNGSSHQLVQILASASGTNSLDYTIYPSTITFSHAVTADRTAGTTSLTITASGVGWSVLLLRETVPSS